MMTLPWPTVTVESNPSPAALVMADAEDRREGAEADNGIPALLNGYDHHARVRVVRLPHFSHATLADGEDDFVGAGFGAGSQVHGERKIGSTRYSASIESGSAK
ncbi:MAG TPA: hypothetical protein VHY84_03380 [Bryobacteraceae bacterium]|jgi:hypothetical protein|nr:hypothetical protein [Bryobacteraceae bacterium]